MASSQIGMAFGFLWRDGKFTDLGRLNHDVAMNNHGETTCHSGSQLVLWRNGNGTISMLAGATAPAGYNAICGNAINDKDQIAGRYYKQVTD